MDSPTEIAVIPSPKPLGLLGRDEMNLAEFPISLLTDRVPKDQNVAVYQDEIHDERTNLTLTRKLTITAGNHGLTTAADDDVILSLIQLTREKNNFTNRRVEFSRHELVQRLGWAVGGASYERLLLSLKRWTSVFLQYENAWRDNRTKTWKTAGFHIIDKYEITDTRTNGGQLELLPSYIVWGEDLFESFQAGYLKPLDYDLCMGLRNSTAKRMYRFLDKRFYHDDELQFDLKTFAHEHIGLSHHYEGPAHLKRNLFPAIEELEEIGFLQPLSREERFPRLGREWKIRLIKQQATRLASASSQTSEAEAKPSQLEQELTNRGVHAATAGELVQRFPADRIESKLEVFDYLVDRGEKRLAKNPAGYLVKSISEDYADPKGFKPKAERDRQAECERQAQAQAAADRRRRQLQDAADKDERKAINAYRNNLSTDQLATLEASAIAEADASIRDTLNQTKEPAIRRMLVNSMIDEHIRQLLRQSCEMA